MQTRERTLTVVEAAPAEVMPTGWSWRARIAALLDVEEEDAVLPDFRAVRVLGAGAPVAAAVPVAVPVERGRVGRAARR